jgi:membrane fusion protein, multidrug efflux system
MNHLFPVMFALSLSACAEKAEPPKPLPRMVLEHAVLPGSASAQIEYSGEVRARHETSLAFRVAGKMTARLVDVGDRVVADQVLARLDAADLALSSSGAEANLAAVAAERAFAQAEALRYRDLRAQQFVSQALLDAKEAALKSAEERYRALAAQSSLAGNQRAYSTLRADAAGVVVAALAEAGQVVSAGQPVVKVARTDEIEVLVAVPENRVAELARSGELDVTLWAVPEKRYRGRVREIAPQADAVTRTFATRIAILNADAEVRLGQTARVRWSASPGQAAALIPLGSVFQHGGQPAVWLIGGNGRVHLHSVRVAAWREDGVVVDSGLSGGERIVAAGAHKLVEGEVVQVAVP